MKYRTILADPPWAYRQQLGRGKKSGDTTRGGLPYKAMTVSEITFLPVTSLADDDATLFLWSTNSHLHEAFHVIEAWHFEYKTMVTWGKSRFGLGYWLRGQTEHLLLAVRGNPRKGMTGPHGATGKAWSTLILDKAGDHSGKPQVFLDMIEDIAEPPRLELFARAKRFGWDTWGNETFCDVPLHHHGGIDGD